MNAFPIESKVSLHEVFPTLDFNTIVAPDMSVGSSFFGTDPNHDDLETAENRIQSFQEQHPNALLANGYLESRSFYNTPNYKRDTPHGVEFRNVHLGTDFWVPAHTPIHAPWEGKVVINHNNAIRKDYGPLLVLEHAVMGQVFYTLYGHLTTESLAHAPLGKTIQKGALLAWIGDPEENGQWVPHLHFQLITDLLGNTTNFPGVAFPSDLKRWTALCPNPDLVFKEYLPIGITLEASQ